MAAANTYPVDLYIYDLTRGMARQFAPMILGSDFDLEGVWHTAVVVHGVEWFFGGGGIETVSPPGTTMLGSPMKTQRLGFTHLDLPSFRDYLDGIGRAQFAGNTYDLFRHNCNNFSHEVAQFLCPNSPGVPRYILDLPDRLLQTPLGAMLRPMIEEMIPHGENLGTESSVNTDTIIPTSSRESNKLELNKHIPSHEIQGFRSDVDGEKLKKKLSELNVAHTNDKADFEIAAHPISPEYMQTINDVLTCSSKVNEDIKIFDDLWKYCIKPVLLTWPKDQLFPMLDLLRWQLGNKHSKALSEAVTIDILEMFLMSKHRFLSSEAAETALRLSLYVITNIFLHPPLQKILLNRREDLIGVLNNLIEDIEIFAESENNSTHYNQKLQVAIATIALNYSIIVANLEAQQQEEASFQVISALGTDYLGKFHSHEALYRTVLAIGNLLSLDSKKTGSVKDLALALDINSSLSASLSRSDGTPNKLQEAINECSKLLQ